MAGQFTFTNGPLFHGDCPWISRAMMSLPVPLSPWINTGTLALATLSIRFRSACIASDLPKITCSGGNSPSDWTKELSELVVCIGIFLRLNHGRRHVLCIPKAKILHFEVTSAESRVQSFDSAVSGKSSGKNQASK